MRAEVKVGLIVVLIAFSAGAIWWLNQGANQLDNMPLDRRSVEQQPGNDVALARDAVPTVSDAKEPAETPAAPPGHSVRISPPAVRRAPLNTRVESPGSDAAGDGSGEQPSTAVPDPNPLAEPMPGAGSRLNPTVPVTEPEPLPLNAGAAPTEQPDNPPKDSGGKVNALDAPIPEIETPRERKPTETLGASPFSSLPSSTTPPRKKYVIEAGDVLIDLAKEEYGDGKLWEAIKAANPGLDEKRLLVGQEIEIPSPAEARRLVSKDKPTTPAARKTDVVKATSRKAANPRATYVVGHGDTLIKIARNVLGNPGRWKEIYELNKDQLDSPDMIRPGMELNLPARKTSTAGGKG